MKTLKDHSDEEVRQLGESLYEENKQGPVMFIAPELGPFSKVGDLSTMVWELAKELVGLGLDIHVVSPYYNVNRRARRAISRSPASNTNWIRCRHLLPPPWTRMFQLPYDRNRLISLGIFCLLDRLLSKSLN
jgi:hypothetical protein